MKIYCLRNKLHTVVATAWLRYWALWSGILSIGLVTIRCDISMLCGSGVRRLSHPLWH